MSSSPALLPQRKVRMLWEWWLSAQGHCLNTHLKTKQQPKQLSYGKVQNRQQQPHVRCRWKRVEESSLDEGVSILTHHHQKLS